MRQRPRVSSTRSTLPNDDANGDKSNTNDMIGIAGRSSYSILALFVLVIYGAWSVHHHQFETLPLPLTLQQVGKRGFSEEEALKHVEALTQLGPHPVGSDALQIALQYVKNVSDFIKKTAHWEVSVEADLFHVKSGVNVLVGGQFKGRSLVYSDLCHVVLRIKPKYASEAGENAILVSSHIDTVFSAEGAGDCSSCVAVMLELARGVSQLAHGFKNAVIFLFNTGEEEGLTGAHSFITQHPWRDTIRVAVDLESMGIGGKSAIFQTGPDPWAIENFAAVAKYPSAQILSQDLFSSGAIKSATDFQVYREIAGLSGLDFAYTDNSAVYHTKNDKLKLLKPGSLQHLGENMLSFLLHSAASDLPKSEPSESDKGSVGKKVIYFDILGTYMITFPQRLGDMLYQSVIAQSLLLWAASIYKGGYPAFVAVALSCLSVLLTWLCSISFTSAVAIILPFLSISAVPFVSCPLLVVGLFGAPALVGALIGQNVGHLALESYLCRTFSGRKRNLPASLQATVAKLDAERWLFKAGFIQWLLLLVIGTYYQIGVSYIALTWLVSPAFAYGFLEATLSPERLPRPLRIVTLIIGSFVPILLSAGLVIRVAGAIVGSMVRIVWSPGAVPHWLGNMVVGVFISIVVCLMLWHLLCYVHISDAKTPVVIAASAMFVLSLVAVISGVIPPFTEDTARSVNVVHVVDATKSEPASYISMFSGTPGNLNREAEHVGEGFVCGRDRDIDLVTFSVKYDCWTKKNAEMGWLKSEIPVIRVEKDTRTDNRVSLVSIDTRVSNRWFLGINLVEIEDFQLEDGESGELIPVGEKSNVDGWHMIQFSGGKRSPTKFNLTLFWVENANTSASVGRRSDEPLLRLRTDVPRLTPPAKEIISRLPIWCSLFGKSTVPHTFAFLRNLPVF